MDHSKDYEKIDKIGGPLLKGLVKHNPEPPKATVAEGRPTVDSGANREGVSKQQPTIGPRTA